MRKTEILAVCLATCALLPHAHAENRLFPTDILKQGEIDTSAGVSHQTYSYDFNGGNPGKNSSTNTSESAQLRYGLGANWHLGAALNYASQSRVQTEYANTHFDRSSEGIRNPTLWATYGIINEPSNPFSLNGELLVTPKTTSYHSSYAARITAGWKSSETLRLFGGYEIREQSDANSHDSNSIGVGAYKEIANGITLIPFAGYVRYNPSSTYRSYSGYLLRLSANMELVRNTYLTPTVDNFGLSSINRKDGLVHQDSTGNGLTIKLGLYHLF